MFQNDTYFQNSYCNWIWRPHCSYRPKIFCIVFILKIKSRKLHILWSKLQIHKTERLTMSSNGSGICRTYLWCAGIQFKQSLACSHPTYIFLDYLTLSEKRSSFWNILKNVIVLGHFGIMVIVLEQLSVISLAVRFSHFNSICA